MKTSYKFIFITLLISSVIFLTLNDIPNLFQNKVLETFTNEDTKNPSEFISLSNSDGMCAEDSLKIHKPYTNNENTNQNEWYLIWQDEFEKNCLDSSNWHIEDWAAEKNNELQYYSPNNVKVEDGFLQLISKNEKYKGREYTSGAVHTKGKFSFLYGKVEMKAKLPSGKGMFPAFWMMPNKEDIWLPEIDIMEMLGHQPDEVWMVSHWLDNTGTLKSDSNTFKGSDFSKDFHTFSIEWTPNSITWLIDDIERFRSSKYIPRESMYLYINTAIGGNWPGSPDYSTAFPVNYEIDYVRVYKSSKE